MRLQYKNNRLERILIGVNALAAAFVAATFVLLFGFYQPLLPKQELVLYAIQIFLLCVFIAEKVVRLFNAFSKLDFLGANWFEVPLLTGLVLAIFGAVVRDRT